MKLFCLFCFAIFDNATLLALEKINKIKIPTLGDRSMGNCVLNGHASPAPGRKCVPNFPTVTRREIQGEEAHPHPTSASTPRSSRVGVNSVNIVGGASGFAEMLADLQPTSRLLQHQQSHCARNLRLKETS